MRNHMRVFALLSIVILVAVACSKPKEQTAQVGGTSKGASALEDEGTSTPDGGMSAAADPSAPKVADTGPAAKGYAALNPAADVEQAKRVGRLIKLQSTEYSNANTWTGVNKDTIKLAFSEDQTNCGVNIINIISQAGGNFSPGDRFYRPAPTDQDKIDAENKEAIENIVRYWNEHVGDVANDIPQAVEVMKRFNKPGHNFYGRKLVAERFDGGSFQCPDRTTAGAVKVVNQIKPFSVVTYDVPGLNQTGYNMSAALHAKAPANVRPMHFGLIDPSDKFLEQWAPYVWAEFQSITRMSQLATSWICSRLVGKNAVNSSQYNDTTRKFALLYPNNPNAKQAAAEFKGFANQYCGRNIISEEIVFNDNPARAADEGQQIMVRLKLAGVTSVVYLVDFLGAFFHIVQAFGQDYRPEWVWVGTGAQTDTVQRLFTPQDMVDKASIGYSSFGIQGFTYGATDAFWTYHAYHKVAPNGRECDPRTDEGMMHSPEFCRAPAAIDGWYYSWLPLIGGLIFAGPNLTPGTVSAGLHAYPLTRYGVDGPTTDPQAVLVGAGPGQYYFITDGSEYRWRSGYVSPPPEKLLGWAEYPDCQRHYTLWPDQLAQQWERDGPNYNAYCGDAKYAPDPYEPREDSCADTPSGRCEKDGYPRWKPYTYR